MNLMDLKDRLTGEIQRKTDRNIYVKALSPELHCIAEKKNKSNPIVFIYNENTNKIWKYNYNDFSSYITSKLICIFVCKDDNENEEYHLVSFLELLSMNNIDIYKFIENKKTEYIFNDISDQYKNNWKVFD